MTSALLAIFTIIAGGLIRLFSTTTGRNPGMTRLISYGVMAAGVALLAMNSVILIDVGEVGVEHFLGRVNERPHAQGVHVVNPSRASKRCRCANRASRREGRSSASRPRPASS